MLGVAAVILQAPVVISAVAVLPLMLVVAVDTSAAVVAVVLLATLAAAVAVAAIAKFRQPRAVSVFPGPLFYLGQPSSPATSRR
jgi:hypothetical protein